MISYLIAILSHFTVFKIFQLLFNYSPADSDAMDHESIINNQIDSSVLATRRKTSYTLELEITRDGLGGTKCQGGIIEEDFTTQDLIQYLQQYRFPVGAGGNSSSGEEDSIDDEFNFGEEMVKYL